LVGTADNSEFYDISITQGRVESGEYTRGTGGMIGAAVSSSIVRSFTTTNVRGISYYAGGLVGYLDSSSITDSYAIGVVSGYANLGGLVGTAASSWVENSYSTGAVQGEIYTGGLIGGNFGSANTVISSYWNIETSGLNTSYGGVGKTTQQMMQKDTYRDWDFDNTWRIDNGNRYPEFQTPGYIYNCEALQKI